MQACIYISVGMYVYVYICTHISEYAFNIYVYIYIHKYILPNYLDSKTAFCWLKAQETRREPHLRPALFARFALQLLVSLEVLVFFVACGLGFRVKGLRVEGCRTKTEEGSGG